MNDKDLQIKVIFVLAHSPPKEKEENATQQQKTTTRKHDYNETQD